MHSMWVKVSADDISMFFWGSFFVIPETMLSTFHVVECIHWRQGDNSWQVKTYFLEKENEEKIYCCLLSLICQESADRLEDDTADRLSAILYKGDNFCDFLFGFSAHQIRGFWGSTLKGKNLLPR